MGKKHVVKFKFKNSTKGAHRFEEVDEDGDVVEYKDATIGALYLRKSAIGDNAPENIEVEIKL